MPARFRIDRPQILVLVEVQPARLDPHERALTDPAFAGWPDGQIIVREQSDPLIGGWTPAQVADDRAWLEPDGPARDGATRYRVRFGSLIADAQPGWLLITGIEIGARSVSMGERRVLDAAWAHALPELFAALRLGARRMERAWVEDAEPADADA